jgi:hypothetical protein
MQPIRIYPQYILILNYDIKAGVQETYFRYVTSEFLPALQKRKIYMQNAWHIVYSNNGQTERQIEFITEKSETLRILFDDPEWDDLETRLIDFTENFTMRIIHYKGTFRV